MGAKGFLSLSSKESLAAYKGILEHSHGKWRTAINITNTEDYGTAMSTAIVSVEELVKALIVAMNGYGFEFRKAPTMQRFFRNHQIRYLLAYAMFLTSVFTRELAEWILKLKSNPSEEIDKMQRIFANDPAAMSRLEAYGILKFRLAKKEFEWFEKVDIFRQDGMYSDFDDVMKNPLTISKEAYTEAMDKLERVKNVGLTLIETLESSDDAYINYYSMLKASFKEGKYYEKIEVMLKGMKRPNVPFESLRESFTNSLPEQLRKQML